MLRVCFLQQWYAPADEALEDALYDSQALRDFARIDLGADAVADAITPLEFRRLLESHDLCKGLFQAINADLSARVCGTSFAHREESVSASKGAVSGTDQEQA